MKENSRIIKNSLILYVRLTIVSVTGLLSSRYILEALGAADFGLYAVVAGVVLMIAVLNDVMVSTTQRFITYDLGKYEPEYVNMTFNTSLLIHISLAILILLVSETLGVYIVSNYLTIELGKLEDALFVFHLSMISVCFTVLQVPYQGLLIAKEKFSITASIESIRSINLLLGTLFLLYYPGNRLRLYAVIVVAVSIITFALYFFFSRKRYKVITKWNLTLNFKKIKEMLSFSFWIMFGASASIGEIQGSALIINNFYGTVLNASFGISNQVNNLVKTFAQSVNKAFIPQVIKSYSSGNLNRSIKLVVTSSKFSFFLMMVPSLPILLETDYLLKIWLTTIPEYTAIFIKIMVVNALIFTVNAGIPAAIQASGKIKYFQIILSLLKLLGIPISYLLLSKDFPPYFLLYTYTALAVISLFIRQLLLKKIVKMDLSEFYLAYFKMFLVLLLILPLFSVVDYFDEGFIRFLSISSLSIIWLGAVIYGIGMDKSERNTILNFVKKRDDRQS